MHAGDVSGRLYVVPHRKTCWTSGRASEEKWDWRSQEIWCLQGVWMADSEIPPCQDADGYMSRQPTGRSRRLCCSTSSESLRGRKGPPWIVAVLLGHWTRYEARKKVLARLQRAAGSNTLAPWFLEGTCNNKLDFSVGRRGLLGLRGVRVIRLRALYTGLQMKENSWTIVLYTANSVVVCG